MLEELIEESRRTRDQRRTQREIEEAERRQREEGQLNAVITAVIARIDDSLPEPLRPFAAYAGPLPKPEQLNGYPDRWTPSEFKIAAAPGLIDIEFTTTAADPTTPLRVVEIRIRNSTDIFKYGVDWAEAIADSADVFDAGQVRAEKD